MNENYILLGLEEIADKMFDVEPGIEQTTVETIYDIEGFGYITDDEIDALARNESQMDGTLGYLGGIWSKVKSAVSSITKGVTSVVNKVKSVVSNIKNFVNKVKTGLGSGFKLLDKLGVNAQSLISVTALLPPPASAVAMAASVFKSKIDAVKNVIKTIEGVVAKVGGQINSALQQAGLPRTNLTKAIEWRNDLARVDLAIKMAGQFRKAFQEGQTAFNKFKVAYNNSIKKVKNEDYLWQLYSKEMFDFINQFMNAWRIIITTNKVPKVNVSPRLLANNDFKIIYDKFLSKARKVREVQTGRTAVTNALNTDIETIYEAL